MSTPTTPVAGEAGWHRPDKRSPWRAIVQGDTEADALGKLLDAVSGGDKVVLPAGVDPNDKTPLMCRRRF